jgi:hypothetical protein
LARVTPLRKPIAEALGLKNTLARPARSAATAAALALSIGSLVAGLAFEATVRHEDAAEQASSATRQRDPVIEELAPLQPDPVVITDSTRQQLRPIVHGLNAVLAVVAVINLLAAALLSLRQRRRDIAVTRAIGLTPQQVTRSILCSDGLLGMAAALVGIPFGCAIFLGVYRIVNGNTHLAVLPPAWQVAAVPVVCTSAVLALVAVPARYAAHRSIIDGLHYE